jgi:hypothetical protein
MSGAQKSLIWLRFRYCCMVSMESCEKFACDYIRRFPLRFLWSEIEQQKFSDHTEI